MGIELDVLTGHPEHDLLFVATQVARAAGLKDPATSVSDYRKLTTHREMPGKSLCALIGNLPVSVPMDAQGKKYRTTTMMFPESAVYQMLLRGHAPASEPFRKWVTEEVLPTIRKTGKYDAEESTNPIAQSVMDELKTLRADVAELKDFCIKDAVFRLSDALPTPCLVWL
ncbi:BRO family protein [Pseudomonas sp. MWU12-2037]|uniref:BRO-N domain-containing protein n=1 Tax=Pseudomonas sp. MWU12-2037 TaxID=2928690 RepID=UPI0020106E93|nr:BRO family protein [Pseudomonas sp. MWU12-2037]